MTLAALARLARRKPDVDESMGINSWKPEFAGVTNPFFNSLSGASVRDFMLGWTGRKSLPPSPDIQVRYTQPIQK